MEKTITYGARDLEKGEQGFYFSQRERENYTPLSCLENIKTQGLVKALKIDVKMTLDDLAAAGSFTD